MVTMTKLQEKVREHLRSCRRCKNEKTEPIYSLGEISGRHCHACGFVFAEPSEAEIERVSAKALLFGEGVAFYK